MSQAGDERELDLSPWRKEDAKDEEGEEEVEMGGAKEESPIEETSELSLVGLELLVFYSRASSTPASRLLGPHRGEPRGGELLVSSWAPALRPPLTRAMRRGSHRRAFGLRVSLAQSTIFPRHGPHGPPEELPSTRAAAWAASRHGPPEELPSTRAPTEKRPWFEIDVAKHGFAYPLGR